jgi:dTDP-4-amino-4,6-dideoxygalactose transaminase
MTVSRTITFGKPWITDDERNAVMNVLSGDVLTHGPQAHAFEQEFAAFMGKGATAISLSSGMAALHLAYWQLGIGPGDEVLVAAQTHVATAHAVEAVGARVVFVDCEANTGNINPMLLEAAITKKTRAIGLVHFLGIPCDMDLIMAVADKHGLYVIEDCALAVGSRHRGKHVGLFGHAACFSFYPVKHITTGDGGMFVSRLPELAQKVGKARAFGVDRSFSERSIPGMYDVPTLGINYRLSDINSSIGRQQLNRIDEILQRRSTNFAKLKQGLMGIANTTVLDCIGPESVNSHYCLSIVLEGKLGESRNAIVGRLKQEGVGTSVYYPHPVPRLAYYREKYGYDGTSYPQATRISDQSIALPIGPHLSIEDMVYIAELFINILKEFQ